MDIHLQCEQLLKDTNKEYKKMIDALNGLLSGNNTAEQVNDTVKKSLKNVDNLIANYETKRG